MSGLGIFQPSTLGMRSTTHQLNVIGFNIANVNTGGFKRSDVQFETVLSDSLFQQSDTGGVKPYTTSRIADQGVLSQTQRDLDLGINGDGFFQLSPTLDVGTDLFYTRDGSFQINTVRSAADGSVNQTTSVTNADGTTTSIDNGYLVDKNGMYLLGIAADPTTGLFTSSAAAAPMQVDPAAFTNVGSATTAAKISINLPAEKDTGDAIETHTLQTFDSAFAARAINFDFIPGASDNQWQVSLRADNATTLSLSPGAPLSVAANAATPTTMRMQANTISLLNSSGVPVKGSFLGLSKGDSITTTGFTNASNNGTFTVGDVAADGSSITLDGTPITSTGPTLTIPSLSFTAGTKTISAVSATSTPVPGAFTGVTVGQQITIAGTSSNNGTLTVATVAADGSSITVAENITDETDSSGAAVTRAFIDETDADSSVASLKNIGSPLTFNSNATLSTPLSYTVSATWSNGATSNFTVDFSDSTQFAGGFRPFFSEANGNVTSNLASVRFDESGQVIGTFGDGTNRAIYKIPMAFFVNPDGLETSNGMLFQQSAQSGEPTTEFADAKTGTNLGVGMLELSNVDIAQEFSRMIQAQHAYNLSATTFRTADEMLEGARDLKR